MNREIKFRAWDKMNHKMIYPDGITKSLDAIMYDGTKHIVHQYHSFLKWMFYTGLSDKNGKEIFEGDIVKIIYTPSTKPTITTWSVNFDGGEWCLYCLSENTADSLYSWDSKDLNIIGNIHQNPELLEKIL